MIIRYKINNIVKTLEIANNKTVGDLRNIILERNNIDRKHKIRFFLGKNKMIKSRKLNKYQITSRSIILVHVLKKTIKDRISSAMSPRKTVRRVRAGGIFGPRGNDWSWSESR